MLDVLQDYKKKIKEDVTEQQFQDFLDSIELTDAEKGTKVYESFKNTCKEVGIGS